MTFFYYEILKFSYSFKNININIISTGIYLATTISGLGIKREGSGCGPSKSKLLEIIYN